MSFIYEKKETKGQGRRQFIMSRYGVRFHFGHAISSFTENDISVYQKKCLHWLDCLTQKQVDHYRDNYYKSTAYVGRAKVESDFEKGKLKKPANMPVAKPVNGKNSKNAQIGDKSTKRISHKVIKRTVKKTLKKAVKKNNRISAKNTK